MPNSRPVSLNLELQEMRQKSDLQVSSHSFLRDHYLSWGQRLNLYTLLFSAVLLFFTLASEDFLQRTLGLGPDSYKWAMGTSAFFTFCLSLIDLAWNPTSKSKAHDQAVGHYLRMNYEVRNLVIAGEAVTAEKIRWIQDEFLDAADLPRIPEGQALGFKQRHLIKLAMTRMLELNPHQPLWWMRVRLWWDPKLAAPRTPAAMPAPPAMMDGAPHLVPVFSDAFTGKSVPS